MKETESVIVAKNLSKVFKDFWGRTKAIGVNNTSFEIRPGEVVSLLGPNGSGKSTTIKMILNLLYPSSGDLKVFGKSPSNTAVKARIGYLPEETYLYKFLTGKEILKFFGKLFNLPAKEAEKRSEELLEMVGMSNVRKRTIGEFSKGMARRIGLAQSLINNPDLLILDEPTSGLDPIGCSEVKNLIGTLKEKGKTILVTSHILSDIEDVSDRAIIMYGGKIIADGALKELLKIAKETTITISNHSNNETLTKIREFINKELKASEYVKFGNPTMSLEEYFLNIINEANKGKIETSGAVTGHKIAKYLSN